MKKKNAYKLEKASIFDNFWALKDIKIPYIFLAGILLATLISTYAGLNIAFFTGDMVDANGNVPAKKLFAYVISYLLIGLGAALNTIFTQQASQRINRDLRIKLWKKIMYTNQQSYEKDGAENLVSRITTDCNFASTIITTIISLGSIIVEFIIYYFRMFKLNTKMATACLLIIPISTLIGWFYAKFRFNVGQKTQNALSNTTTYLVERTKNLNLIKSSNAQNLELKNGAENFEKQYINELKNGLLSSGYIALQHLYSIIDVLIPFVIGAKLVNDRIIRAGVVIAFYSMAGATGMLATNIIDEVGSIRNANGALARVITVLKLKDEPTLIGKDLTEFDKDITVNDLSFAYNENYVLNKLNCIIPTNKVTVIIGANGSGKTTLFKLLNRLFEPKEGCIKLGEEEATNFNLQSWRKNVCLIAQDSPMLEGSIRDNICYGVKEEVSDERLIEVAKKARVYDFVSKLPQGFETIITNNADNLSGGQRQCVAIARAIMNNPKYLLLDEATSNLDAESEHLVLEALEQLMKGRTTVMIAHSLATIKYADNIIVLNNGEIKETGTPEDILKTTDNYLNKIINRHAN